MKKLISLIAGLTLALTIAPTVKAESLALAGDINVVGVVNAQLGHVDNFIFTNANSGFDTVSGKKITTDTGNASAVAVVASDENSNSTAVTLGDTGTGPLAENYLKIGKKIKKSDMDENTAIAVDLNAAVVANFNMGGVDNFVTTLANTGWNTTTSTGKKGSAGSTTGDATAVADVSTKLNTNKTDVTVSDSESGPQAINWTEFKKSKCHEEDPCIKGADLDGNLAVALDANIAGVVNFNAGMVNNGVFTAANTGGNITSGKKTSSDTGDAIAGAVVATTLNTNDSSVSILDSGTGPKAVNSEEYKKIQPNHDESVAIAGDVNLAVVANVNLGMVNNMVMTSANSGFNPISNGSSDTGKAIAGTTVTNDVNKNTSHVTITDSGTGASAMNSSTDTKDQGTGSPCDPSLPCGQTGGTTAANVGTSGTTVAVDATAAVVANANVADVNNMTATTANTGGNQGTPSTTSQGCGNSSSSTTTNTGDATAATNVSNTVNTNTTTVVITK